MKRFQTFLIGDINKKEWARMFHLVALASITGSWIFSVCPNMAPSIWILLHVVLELRVISEVKSMPMVFIIWSRDGNVDATRGIWFHPNHFIPLIEVGYTIKEKQFKDHVCTTHGKITSFFGPNESKKRKLTEDDGLSTCNGIKSETKPEAPRNTHKSETTKGRRATYAIVGQVEKEWFSHVWGRYLAGLWRS